MRRGTGYWIAWGAGERGADAMAEAILRDINDRLMATQRTRFWTERRAAAAEMIRRAAGVLRGIERATIDEDARSLRRKAPSCRSGGGSRGKPLIEVFAAEAAKEKRA